MSDCATEATHDPATTRRDERVIRVAVSGSGQMGRMVLETKTTDESGKTNVVTRTFNKKK